MVEFNPFDKPLEALKYEDLDKLRENNVAEGYSIEYKRDVPGSEPGRSIAKVIASFANTYGGWLILGITEEFNNEAGEPCGINLSDHPQAKETVQQWVQTRIQPIPHFASQLLKSPEDEDKAVLVVRVSESWDTPHVMDDGVVYRRTGEQSNPIEPETDRWTLDRLYQRRSEREQTMNRVLQHLKALNNELEINQKVASGNKRVIQALQQGKTRRDADHYVVDPLSTDAWDASLEGQMLDVIDSELYQEIQEFFFSIKKANELIKRTRNEYLHPEVGKEGDPRMGRRVWTMTVNYWDEKNEEVNFYGLGSLIYKQLAELEGNFGGLQKDLDAEIDCLESELQR